MTTIPIEVIIQDAESPVTPTPTPESGEETNITVPDTGTISDVNNSGGIGSSASIILSAIIVILAIGAMVAIIVRRYQKRKSNTETTKLSRKEKLATAASGTIAILAATILVGNLVIPATKAASDDAGSSSDEGTYLETEDKVSIVATIDKDSKEPTIVNVKDTLYATTDASGYTVTMSMIEDALTANLYLNGDEASQYYIAPVEVEGEGESEGTAEGVELVTNTWGYRLSEDDGYLPVPVADTPAIVAEGEVAVTHEEIDVYYGLKVDGTLPLGTYSGEIEYNITPVNPIDKLTYMQDFAKLSEEDKTKLLASMPEGEQYILKDKRDEKPYYISKLADGNVWMTQNLDHNIGDIDGGTYRSADTDLPSNATWTPSSNERTYSAGATTWNGSYSAPESYDPGNRYWDGVVEYIYDGTIDNRTTASGNAHYHIGNYYNWTAAVAMSNSSEYYEDRQDPNQSICPAGWRLPTYDGNKSYEDLMDAQNIIGGTEGNSQSAPTYFVYGGCWRGLSEDVAYDAVYRLGPVHSNNLAYALVMVSYNSEIYSHNGNYGRSEGYLIRCVAR